MLKLGFVGAGNMGSAILRGLIAAKYISADDMAICDLSAKKLEALSDEIPGLTCTESDQELVEMCDMVILAVKPQYMAETIEHIHPYLSGKAVVSIAAGWTVDQLAEALEGSGATYLRVMPNTPAMVGEAMSALCPNEQVSEEELSLVKQIFDCFGVAEVVKESLIDAVIGVSGSSPAYVYMFIEAMADAAVLAGMPRKQAYTFAAQAVLGSAKMVLETGIHPGELKDMVCSPGGTTIEAVAELEKHGMRSAVIEAMKACMDKSKEMSQKK